MQVDLARTAGYGRAAWRWWTGELVAMMPEPLRAAWARSRRDLEIAFDGTHLRPRLLAKGQTRELGEVPLPESDPQTAAAALKALLREDDDETAYDRLVLRIDESRLLRRRLALPLAARADLAEALGYDIDRQTPFSPEEVYFAVAEHALDREAGQVTVDFVLVRRDDLDPVLASLRRAGLRLDRIEGTAGGPALAPEQAAWASRILWPRVTAGLTAAALVLAVIAAALPLSRVEARMEAVRGEIAEAREAATEAQSLREDIEALRQREDKLLQRKQSEPRVVGLLASLTEAMPEGAFVTELTYEDDELTMTGYARRASDVLGAVERSDAFSSARFLSPVTRDQRLERERFSLSARIAGGSTETADGAAGGSPS